jgi:hypothetical protein
LSPGWEVSFAVGGLAGWPGVITHSPVGVTLVIVAEVSKKVEVLVRIVGIVLLLSGYWTIKLGYSERVNSSGETKTNV